MRSRPSKVKAKNAKKKRNSKLTKSKLTKSKLTKSKLTKSKLTKSKLTKKSKQTTLRGGNLECLGQKDIYTFNSFSERPSSDDETDIRYAIRLNDQNLGEPENFRCYDVRRIKQHVESRNSSNTEYNVFHPLTRALLTVDQLEQIDAKILVLQDIVDASGNRLLTDDEATPIPREVYNESLRKMIGNDVEEDFEEDFEDDEYEEDEDYEDEDYDYEDDENEGIRREIELQQEVQRRRQESEERIQRFRELELRLEQEVQREREEERQRRVERQRTNEELRLQLIELDRQIENGRRTNEEIQRRIIEYERQIENDKRLRREFDERLRREFDEENEERNVRRRLQ